jgi:PPM family protein phosphatase
MRIAIGAKTDVGLKRPHNEDDLCVDPEVGLFVVCDGLGGRNAGEVASRLAIEVIHKHIREAQRNANLPMVGAYDRQFSPLTNRLASAIRLANQAIRDAAKDQPDQEGMGTTVVSAMLNGQMLSVAHVGDSRLYLIRGDTIEPLTADHSLVVDQVRRGLLTEEEAERSPERNIITRALGVDDAVDVELGEVPLMQEDQLLLCSDGLTRDVKPGEILATVRREKDPQAAAERLVELANAAGGLDNTTVILISIQHGAGETPMQRVWNRLVS